MKYWVLQKGPVKLIDSCSIQWFHSRDLNLTMDLMTLFWKFQSCSHNLINNKHIGIGVDNIPFISTRPFCSTLYVYVALLLKLVYNYVLIYLFSL